MITEKSKATMVIESNWGGCLTHEKVGMILALADEAGGGDKWDEALQLISGHPTQEQVDDFMEELAALINNF